MKRTLLRASKVLPIIALLSIVLHAYAENQPTTPHLKLSLCTEANARTANVSKTSLGVQKLIKDAAKQLNIQINVEALAWNRCIHQTKNERYDGLFSLFWTPERQKFLVFPPGSDVGTNTEKVAVSKFYFYEHKDNPLDLDNIVFGVGAPLGYVASDKLAQLNALSPVSYDIRQGMIMVSRQKLDAYLLGEALANEVLNDLNLTHVVTQRQPAFFVDDLHLAFNHTVFHKHEQQILKLWQRIEQVRKKMSYD